MLKNILLVGLGGGIGSILRYIISYFTLKYFKSELPVATFLVNIIGCFLVGVLFNTIGSQNVNSTLKLLFIIGFCGGFTTFSAFAYENVAMLQAAQYSKTLLYTLLSIITGFIAVWAGILLSK